MWNCPYTVLHSIALTSSRHKRQSAAHVERYLYTVAQNVLLPAVDTSTSEHPTGIWLSEKKRTSWQIRGTLMPTYVEAPLALHTNFKLR